MAYLINLYDNYKTFNKDYIKLISYYLNDKAKYKILFDEEQPYNLSIICDEEQYSPEVIEDLDHYFKIKGGLYVIDQYSRDSPPSKEFSGLVKRYKTAGGTSLIYIEGHDGVFIFPLEEEGDYYDDSHRATCYHRITNYNRRSYPNIYSFTLGKIFYLYEKSKMYPEKPLFSQEDFFELLKIRSADHIYWDKFTLQTTNTFSLKYEGELALILLSDLNLRENNDLYGSLHIHYPNKRPIKLSTYTKENINYLTKFFNNLEEWSRVVVRSDTIDVSSVNFHKPYWLAVLGGLLKDRGEKAIPKCFNVQSIYQAYQEFQTYETLAKMKGGV